MTAVPALHFEDIDEDRVFVSPTRTIAEYDLYVFAGLTADFTEFHLSTTAAEATHFGRRVAHGMLIVSIANGLYNRIGVTDGTGLGLMGVEWRFGKPVFIGDTIHLSIRASGKRHLPGKKGGIVFWTGSIINQDGVATGTGTFTRMIAYRNAQTAG